MLVTLADTKAYLGISPSDTSSDVFLTQQINLVSEVVERYCQRIFAQRTYTETYYLSDLRELNIVKLRSLYTHAFPVISVTSLTEFQDENDTVGVARTDFRVNKPHGLLTVNEDAVSFFSSGMCGFFDTGRLLRVVYVGGFATIPYPVQEVVYSVVSTRYNKRKSGVALDFGSDVQRVSIPGVISVDFDYSLTTNDRVSPFGAILGSNMNMLDHFRSERAIMKSTIEYVEVT